MNDALSQKRHVLDEGSVGLVGVVAGPRLYVIDRLARGDALLSRLAPREPWRPGGVPRELPRGYIESIELDKNAIEDPALARYFDALLTVTRGPLFSRKRLRAMVAVNLSRIR